ncbi:MAG: 1-(5-phosphoribosyl)-5-amino-4-imidazole-carboxylate carboxylase [candidate division Zixibacteria bacterium RBG_16_50_21]|nr:MAG: 1-(5-phosphoribosyl)-5-amino-4-imidazole-carboxylate carboxylase [candidate division Zixibacteria bacterium RBG_16_50_21]
MQPDKLLQLLENIKAKRISPLQALSQLKKLPFENLGFANLDHHRHLRKGFPEVIYAPGKTILQIVTIAQALHRNGTPVYVTRAEPQIYRALKKRFPRAEYNELARAVMIRTRDEVKKVGLIAVVSAGTADLPVAEEAALTCQIMGNNVQRIYDVGVAGIHRFLSHWEKIQKARVVIVVAGMEGALASVVAGLIDKPIIAVPTSVGYGTSFGGVAALLTMLNSCANGVTVVNIDNGFAAGISASMINKL